MGGTSHPLAQEASMVITPKTRYREGLPSLSAYAEDHACVPKHLHAQSVAVKAGTPACRHGLWPWMNAKRITLRSLVRRRVCFGGLRRRTWRYHGLCPWGSMTLRDSKVFGKRLVLKGRRKDLSDCFPGSEGLREETIFY